MATVYKYRANLFDKEKGFRQDTKSLLDGEFFASPFKLLNDPFEASVELSPYSKDDHWVNPLMRKIYSAGIYSLAKPKDGESFPENELMWAHYANSHQGFCIEYDLDKLIEGSYVKGFNLTNTIHVKYEYDNPKIVEQDSVFAVQEKVFGTKSKAWEKENEVRLVFETNGVKPIVYGAIQSLYFGLNIGNDERQKVIDTLKNRGVKFYQINRVGKSYKLNAVELNFSVDYEIISTNHNDRVENYNILYKSINKDKNSMQKFVQHLREIYTKPANFTIVDDIRAYTILNDYKPRNQMEDEDIKIMSQHWIALSIFDAPDDVLMYPEK